MWTEYRRAYRDCAVWLARWCRPVAWYWDTYDACRQLRRDVTMVAGRPASVALPRRERGRGTIVPASKAAAERRTIPLFTYAPGDGHLYVWQEGAAAITVKRIITGDRLAFRATGDTIPLPDTATTTALADAVQAWKAARP